MVLLRAIGIFFGFGFLPPFNHSCHLKFRVRSEYFLCWVFIVRAFEGILNPKGIIFCELQL